MCRSNILQSLLQQRFDGEKADAKSFATNESSVVHFIQRRNEDDDEPAHGWSQTRQFQVTRGRARKFLTTPDHGLLKISLVGHDLTRKALTVLPAVF